MKIIMSKLVKKIFFIAVVFCAFIFTEGNSQSRSITRPILNVENKARAAREATEEYYYDLVKEGFFGTFYNNNLIINMKIDESIVDDGTILLVLIDWLEKRNDRDSRYLIKKLSKYFYLKFYQLVYKMDVQHSRHGDLIGMLRDFYKYKIVTPHGILSPFRGVLSKMIILIYMVNFTQLPYERKCEALALTLEKIESEFLAINDTLDKDALAENDIKKFIRIMQVYATKEPLVKASVVNKLIIAGVIVFAVAAIGYAFWRWVVPNADVINARLKNILRPAGEVADDFLEKFERDAGKIANRLANGMLADSEGRPTDIKKTLDDVQAALQEAKGTLQEVKGMMKKVDPVIDEVHHAVRGTNNVVHPLSALGRWWHGSQKPAEPDSSSPH